MGDFYGYKTRVLENQHIRLEALMDGGMRLVRLSLADVNVRLFAEVPDITIEAPLGEYKMLGGHRLWHAPESMPRTYVSDGEGLQFEPTEDGIQIIGEAEPATGIRKRLQVHLEKDRPALNVVHTLQNENLWPVELAPWAITQMRLGGTAILPQSSKPVDASGLLPNRRLSLWPYTRLDDPRLRFQENAILMEGQPLLPPVKIGYDNPDGWMGYWLGGVLFVKRYDLQEGQAYPDGGCSTEVYCNDRFLELESLGPLAKLEPGESVSHTEYWELFTDASAPGIPPSVRPFLV